VKYSRGEWEILRDYLKLTKKAAWRVVLFLLAFLSFVPTVAHASQPPPRAPDALRGTRIVLPFPVDDMPVGVSSAEITFTWDERQYAHAYGNLPFPIYGGTLRADYTIRFTGEEAAYVRIAMLHPNMYRFQYEFRADEIWVDLDGEYILVTYDYDIFTARVPHSGPENLGGQRTPVFEYVVEEVRRLGESRYPIASEVDRRAALADTNVVIFSVPFEPEQERIVSISFPIRAGMEWDREKQQSLFFYTVLTETFRYWDFFGSLTVTTNHPEDVITSVFPQGFERVDENMSKIHVDSPYENIGFGFWLIDDERVEPGAFWGSTIHFAMIMFLPFLIVAGIVVFICVIVSSRRKKKRNKQSSEQLAIGRLKYCPNCGMQCPGDSKFCEYCGSEFKDL